MVSVSEMPTEVCNDVAFEPSPADIAFKLGLDWGLDLECPAEPPAHFGHDERVAFLAGLEKASWELCARAYEYACELEAQADELAALQMQEGAW